MGGSPRGKDKPASSHKDGEFRDPKIAAKQTPDFKRSDLDALIRKAAQVARGSSSD